MPGSPEGLTGGLPANTSFAPRVILLELYHTNNRRLARHEEGKRLSGILVNSVLAALPYLVIPIIPILTYLEDLGLRR